MKELKLEWPRLMYHETIRIIKSYLNVRNFELISTILDFKYKQVSILLVVKYKVYIYIHTIKHITKRKQKYIKRRDKELVDKSEC